MVKSLFGTEEAPYARKAVKRCRDLGAKIVIATAEGCTALDQPQQKHFLKTLGFKESDQKFCDKCSYYSSSSECYKNGCKMIGNPYGVGKRCITIPTKGTYKEAMLTKIISGATNKNRVIFYDDQQPNLNMATSLGVQTQLASSNCKGFNCDDATGLTKEEFEKGLAKVGNKPEMCIFDIDNTLTREAEISEENWTRPKSPWPWILTAIMVILAIILIILELRRKR